MPSEVAINERQYAALRGDVEARWIGRLCEWLRRHAEPARTMSEPTLAALVRRQCDHARAVGITTERALAKWCYLAAMTGERFDTLSEVAAVLRDRSIRSAAQRVDILMKAYESAARRREGP